MGNEFLEKWEAAEREELVVVATDCVGSYGRERARVTIVYLWDTIAADRTIAGTMGAG